MLIHALPSSDERRATIHRGDFMFFNDIQAPLQPDNMSAAPARIEQILTLDMGTNRTYCFLSIRLSVGAGVDHVTGLHMFRMGDHTNMKLIGLPALRGKKQWMVPIAVRRTEFSIVAKTEAAAPGQVLLHVDWNSSFLL